VNDAHATIGWRWSKAWAGMAVALALKAVFLGGLVARGADAPPIVHFDHHRGLYSDPFDLVLKSKPRGAHIVYTMDGGEPSATNGLTYSSPIRVVRTTVVRAKCLDGSSDETAIETRTFVIPDAVPGQKGDGFPRTWGIKDSNAVLAAYQLKLPAGESASDRAALDKVLRALPAISIALPVSNLFGEARGIYTHPEESGEAWERAASVEFIPADDAKGFQIDCGLRIQGGWSRRPEESPKHSLRLVFHKRYGTGHLKYPLFGSETESFGTLILRGGNNNSWLHPDAAERRRADYLRDPWMRETYAAMGHPSSRSRFVHVYLNGLYWGVYNLTERPDARFSAARLGGSDTDYDSRNSDKILSGDDIAWKKLFAAVNAGVADPNSYTAVSAMLDVPAFIDFMILNLYGANGDWDRGSNWYATRRRDPPGRWLFLEWDGERTLESIDDDRMAVDDDECPTRVFQKLRANAGFRRDFAQRAKQLLTGDGLLAPAVSAARYRALADSLDLPIIAEAARWGWYRHDVHPFRVAPYEIYTRDGQWRPEINRILEDYFPKRTDRLIRQLRTAGLYAD
jgi:hypothetical protein